MISTLSQKIGVTAVEDVLVTEIELDDESGEYVREIRIIGADEAVVFSLQLRSEDEDKIKFTTPELEY